jgi:hypothetical protein
LVFRAIVNGDLVPTCRFGFSDSACNVCRFNLGRLGFPGLSLVYRVCNFEGDITVDSLFEHIFALGLKNKYAARERNYWLYTRRKYLENAGIDVDLLGEMLYIAELKDT